MGVSPSSSRGNYSCQDEDEESFHGAIDVLISLSLLVFGVSFHLSCQWFLVRLLIFKSASSNVILFILTKLVRAIVSKLETIASLAALSASSLPIMPVCKI